MNDFPYRLCLYKCHRRFAEGGSCFYFSDPASMTKVGDKMISHQRDMQNNNNTCAAQDLFGVLPLGNRQVRFTNILYTAPACHTAPTRFGARMSG